MGGKYEKFILWLLILNLIVSAITMYFSVQDSVMVEITDADALSPGSTSDTSFR